MLEENSLTRSELSMVVYLVEEFFVEMIFSCEVRSKMPMHCGNGFIIETFYGA